MSTSADTRAASAPTSTGSRQRRWPAASGWRWPPSACFRSCAARPGRHPEHDPGRDHRPGGVRHRRRVQLGPGELDPQPGRRRRTRLLRVYPQVLGSAADPPLPGGGWRERLDLSPLHQLRLLQLPRTLVRTRDRSLLREGDVLVKNNGTSGHVVIYAGGDAWNSPIIYEAPGTGLTVRRVSRYLGSEYQPRRRNSLVRAGSFSTTRRPRASAGNDLSGNWTRSTSISGYYGDNYQVQAATTATAGPAGRRGSLLRLLQCLPALDQRHQPGVGRAGERQHTRRAVQALRQPAPQRRDLVLAGPLLLRAGYSTGTGSVTIWATGANGYVVADAVKFSPTQ